MQVFMSRVGEMRVGEQITTVEHIKLSQVWLKLYSHVEHVTMEHTEHKGASSPLQ